MSLSAPNAALEHVHLNATPLGNGGSGERLEVTDNTVNLSDLGWDIFVHTPEERIGTGATKFPVSNSAFHQNLRPI